MTVRRLQALGITVKGSVLILSEQSRLTGTSGRKSLLTMDESPDLGHLNSVQDSFKIGGISLPS
jgi:hypothetical protein